MKRGGKKEEVYKGGGRERKTLDKDRERWNGKGRDGKGKD